jgi:signal transduction histidine kinase
MTVRWRLTLIATVVFGVAFIAAAWGLVSVVHGNLVDGIKETNQDELALLAAELESGKSPDDLEPQRVDVCIDTPDGRCRFIGSGQVIPRRPQGDEYRTDERIVETDDGPVTLVAQRSLTEVNNAVDNLTRIMWFAVPALIALVGFAIWYLAGRALRPVEAIRSQAEAITGTTLDRRVPEPRTQDEVGRLARTMNAMLDRLETSSQKQRQFVSDASHELRSPIASIRTNLEVALRNADRADWPAVATRALEDDERMEEMVTDLLDLARLDEFEETAPVSSLPEVDLDELVLDETLRPHRAVIDTTRVSAGRVHGRSEQLARVVRNLLDNADRHARSRVALSLQNGADVVELTVDDDGPGIAPEDRDRVFERFTRLDDGRARDAGGLGLGLSMVKSIVERHGGTVDVGDAPIGGARFAVRFPTV